jgi:hypothetical protein
MKSKFKIGDTIHYMENNKPTTGDVTSICSVVGEVEFRFGKVKSDQDSIAIVYFIGTYTTINETNAFKTMEELKESLFSTNG